MRIRRSWLIGSALAAVGLYALMWLGYVQNWTWLTAMDAWALEPMHRLGEAHPGWVEAWNVFCAVLGPNAYRLVALVVIVVALVRRNRHIALFLLISVQLSGFVTEIAKHLVHRPRPDSALVVAHGTSFPSGHAVGTTVGVLALLAVVVPAANAAVRPWLIVLGMVLILAIGFGRVALNVHHPSDVIAGWALGYAYFVACLLIVPPSGRFTRLDETPAAPGSAR